MDTLTHLYEHVRANTRTVPPALEDWLRYWNDEDTDLGNLRNIEHWLTEARNNNSDQATASPIRPLDCCQRLDHCGANSGQQPRARQPIFVQEFVLQHNP
jgi:hypothetical protein